jgi:prepilin-type N-terminal cleavage/methylation domain-containing protein
MSSRGFSLVEALVALFVLGITAVAVLPAFMSQMDANTRNEERSDAMGIAHQRLEALRFQDVDLLPTGGPAESSAVTIGNRQYELRTRYCTQAQYCPPVDPGSRHLLVEVWLDGKKVYDVATIYTELR